MSSPSADPSRSFIKDFLVGGLSAGISRTITAPLERVKILLQNQRSIQVLGPGQHYKGMIDCYSRILSEEGVIALWRGNWANIIRYFPNQGLNFAFKEKYKALTIGIFGKPNPKTEFWKFFGLNILSGGLAGSTSQFFIYPLDFARTRLASDLGRTLADRQFKGMTDCIMKIGRSDGIQGLYRGFTFTVVCYFFYRAFYFGLYDTAKGYLGKDPAIWIKFLVAQASVNVAALVAYPFDTLRRRMMMQSGRQPHEVQFRGSWQTLTKVISQEGFLSLYAGGLANVYRGVGGALVMVLFDEIHKLIDPKAKPTAGE